MFLIHIYFFFYSYRCSRGQRNKSFSFNSDEVHCSSSPPTNLKYNKINKEGTIQQRPSTSIKNIGSARYSMNKRKRSNFADLLGQILNEIGLYDELYEFMKCKFPNTYNLF